MEFTNLKFFRTRYSFNHNESSLYFNNALKSGCGIFMNELKGQYIEDVHVKCSWTKLFKIISVIFLVFTIIGMISQIYLPINLILFSISILFKVLDYILSKKIRKLTAGYELTKSFLKSDNYSFLEESRKDLL